MTSATLQKMALSIVAGTHGLIQLGLSVSDVALLIHQGKRFGNFIRVGQNDGDLFDLIGEDPEAILRRRGLVETSEMEKSWPEINCIHRGKKLKGRIQDGKQPETDDSAEVGRKKRNNKVDTVQGFTWVMVMIVSALDDCLPSNEIKELLIRVFVAVLDGDKETENALRVQITINVESWRSFGCAREISHSIKQEMRKSLSKLTPHLPRVRAIPQLNEAEKQDMENLLIWLLGGGMTGFSAMSAITFSVAEAWRTAKLKLCTDGNPVYEGQACVTYHPESQLFEQSSHPKTPIPRGLGTRTLQISWPRDRPDTMIDALGVGRHIESVMSRFWQYGVMAANDLKLFGGADWPYEETKEVYYSLEEVPFTAAINKKFSPHIGMLANQGFPVDTQKIYEAIENLLEGEPEESPVWLQSHIARDYLLRLENAQVTHEKEYLSVFSKYQALLFGFYYQLLGQILSFELAEPKAFFHGVWGVNSTTFLAMCTQLGRCLRSTQQVSRAHILYMLAAMYSGRRKVFNPNSSIPRLVGVMGPISILSLPLIRTTDIPEEIWKIAVVDLPIVDLASDNSDGELMASEGGGISFVAEGSQASQSDIQPTSPTMRWTVHPHMSMLFGSEKANGVVMAARCGERLVGWFNPLAADISFLSSAYVRESYTEGEVTGFEVKDSDWQSGQIQKPDERSEGYHYGVVQSHGSPELRYAAAGFYGEKGEEVVIARSADEFHGAFGRIEAQEQGIIVA